MDSIKDVITQVIEKMALRQPETQIKIQRIWKNILDAQEEEHTLIVELKEKILYVNVDSPAWLFHVNFKKTKILERLKEEVPEVEKILFKIGKVK